MLRELVDRTSSVIGCTGCSGGTEADALKVSLSIANSPIINSAPEFGKVEAVSRICRLAVVFWFDCKAWKMGLVMPFAPLYSRATAMIDCKPARAIVMLVTEAAPLHAHHSIRIPALVELPSETQLLTGTPETDPAESTMPPTTCDDCAPFAFNTTPTRRVFPRVVVSVSASELAFAFEPSTFWIKVGWDMEELA